MFASVRETPRRHLGSGALLSIAAHASLIATAVLLSPKPRTDDQPKTREMTLMTVGVKPRPAPPAPVVSPDQPKRTASSSPTLVDHKTRRSMQIDPPRTPQTTSQPERSSDDPPSGGGPADPTAHGNGPPTGNGPNGPAVPSYEAIPLPPGLEPPRLLVKTEVPYSAKAWAMKIGGVAVARCVIELDGSLSNCRIVRGLPYMDDAILQALQGWKYTPVYYEGHPQRVLISVPIRLAAPR